jgi:hypothetical protein
MISEVSIHHGREDIAEQSNSRHGSKETEKRMLFPSSFYFFHNSTYGKVLPRIRVGFTP